jgi:type IV pilus assembly protein PilQ
MSKTSKKRCQVTILMFSAVSLLIRPVMLCGSHDPVYAAKTAQAALATKITGDWADEPINKVLKELAEMAKVNIFTSPQVTGNITVNIENVPLEEVLTNILVALGYTYVATDNMIRVVPMHEITRAKEELVSKVYRIKYADANDVAASLREFVSNAGSVGIDRATNHILVTDTEYKIRGIDKFIAELNRPRQQVLVEVKIYDITTRDGFNLGAALYAANIPVKETGMDNLGHPTSVTRTVTPAYTITSEGFTSENLGGYEYTTREGVGGFQEHSNYLETNSATETLEETVPEIIETETVYEQIPPGYGSTYQRPRGAKPYVGGSFDRVRGGTLSFSLLNDSIDLEFALNILKKQLEYKVLANPRILVLDNETAHFEIGRQVPYRELLQVAREDPITYTAFKSVGVQLNVTPQIADDKMIKLHIVPEFGTLVSQNAVSVLTSKDDFGRDVYQNVLGAPTIDVRRTDTVALLKSGQTIAIGGMRRRETSRDISKVPLLGDLPLLGNLFRSHTESVSISELVVLITPRIIDPSETVPAELSADGDNGIPKGFGPVPTPRQHYQPMTEPSAQTSPGEEDSPDIPGQDSALVLKVAYGYWKAGNFTLARDMLESLVAREPKNATAHRHLGYCNLKLANLDAAIENYAAAVSLNDADWEALRSLGVACMLKASAKKDPELAARALEQWRRSLEIKPDQPKARSLAKMIEDYSQQNWVR